MQLLKEAIIEKGAKFLQLKTVQSRIDKQILLDIQAGTKEMFLSDFYFRKKLESTGGIVDIIKDTDSKQTSITNIDKGKLGTGVVLALTGFGVSYGFSASDVQPDAVEYSGAINGASAIPAKFANGEIELRAGNGLIFKQRVRKFLAKAGIEYGIEANDENNLLLPQPKLITGDKKIDCRLELAPNAAAMPAGFHYIELRFQGVYIGDR